MTYAVVFWFNYRKELQAGFMKGFDDFEIAKEYAYSQAEKCNNEGVVITEDDITDKNGPGKLGSPYYGKTIVGYGGSSDGYCTTFYCVVEWFPGVENSWDQFDDDEYWQEQYGSEWYPKYSY
jgi:hypothetical protein